ncbi:MAG: fatty acid cis/trans isomerase [Variovorax sp.]
MRRISSLIAVVLVAACATVAVPNFDLLFGPADPHTFDKPKMPPAGMSYAQQIKPILDGRCVVCHACYDAPCQLKTTSWDGIARGASKIPVYDATRLIAAEPTRLDVDADQASEWRLRGFFPVLNEQAQQTPEANRTAGLMHRLLMQKVKHPLPTEGTVGGGLDFSPDRAAMCPAGGEIDAYEKNLPLGGMPFGLPGLSPPELDTLTRWIEQGAPYEGAAPLSPLAAQRVAMWERFFNGDSNKERLFSRYAYEHLFIAHLYFDDDRERRYFKLVRSSTPPGQPVQIIASRRPVDDPGVARVYYRIVAEQETIVAKTHMPYRLGAERMARWRSLFLDAPYSVDVLPGYTDYTAANPFTTFAALPVGARYRFMLEEAEFTIMGFIKGPVCRGQMAVDVIDDRFWVTFMAPSEEYDRILGAALAVNNRPLTLPTGSSNEGLVSWLHYARLEGDYRKARLEVLQRSLAGPGPSKLDLDRIWDGDGRNDNAGLTVFRHYDSATVVKGLVGDAPKTGWVIGYPLLERLHYLLVADFDIYGNIGHQLDSRLYMDFLRMEGEFNFLTMLPIARRNATRDAWYLGDNLSTREQVYGGPDTTLPVETGIVYRTGDPKKELLDLMKARLAPVLDRHYELDAQNVPAPLLAPLRRLASLQGASLRWLPENTVLVVDAPAATPGPEPTTFSLLRNTAHASVAHLTERHELRPQDDTLTITPGIVGAYPNAFFRVSAAQLPALTEAIGKLGSEADYAALSARWAIRRTNPDFWAVSDSVHRRYAAAQPIHAGVLDYGRLENR